MPTAIVTLRSMNDLDRILLFSPAHSPVGGLDAHDDITAREEPGCCSSENPACAGRTCPLSILSTLVLFKWAPPSARPLSEVLGYVPLSGFPAMHLAHFTSFLDGNALLCLLDSTDSGTPGRHGLGRCDRTDLALPRIT